MERYGIWNDVHFPFEDKQRFELSLRIAEELKIDHLFFNGDIGEFLAFTHWPTHPKDRMGSCAEIDYVNKRFDQIEEQFPTQKKTYICGNHEDRFFRYIRDIAPAMFGLVDCPSILKFPERPLWRFVPYGPTQLVKCANANLYLRHEPNGRGQNHAKSTAEVSVVDIAYGHTHTYQSYTHRKFGPTPIETKAYSLGWLGDKSRHVFDYRGSKDNWVLGFTIVECDPKSGAYTLDFINLENVPVFYRGNKYGFRKG